VQIGQHGQTEAPEALRQQRARGGEAAELERVVFVPGEAGQQQNGEKKLRGRPAAASFGHGKSSFWRNIEPFYHSRAGKKSKTAGQKKPFCGKNAEFFRVCDNRAFFYCDMGARML
jgi:hypothetical protein